MLVELLVIFCIKILNTLIHFILKLEIKSHSQLTVKVKFYLFVQIRFNIYGIDNDNERINFSKVNNPNIKFIKGYI